MTHFFLGYYINGSCRASRPKQDYFLSKEKLENTESYYHALDLKVLLFRSFGKTRSKKSLIPSSQQESQDPIC